MELDYPEIEGRCLEDVKKLLKKYDTELERFSWAIDDKFLLHFVRGKKYKPDKVALAVRNYFLIRTEKYKWVFTALDPEDNPLLKSGTIRILKHQDTCGRMYVFLRFPMWTDVENTCGDDLTRAFLLVVEECWNYEEVERCGIVLLVDLGGFGWPFFKMWHPIQVLRSINIFWNNMPIRYKSIHLLNSGSIFEMTLRAVKPVLPKKMRDRLIIHPSNYTELHKEILPHHLPSSLGGDLSDDESFNTEMEQRIYSKSEYYRRFIKCL